MQTFQIIKIPAEWRQDEKSEKTTDLALLLEGVDLKNWPTLLSYSRFCVHMTTLTVIIIVYLQP